MQRFRFRLILLAALLGCPALALAQPVAIVGGEVHIGNGEVLEGATVVIEAGKITAVGPGRRASRGGRGDLGRGDGRHSRIH